MMKVSVNIRDFSLSQMQHATQSNSDEIYSPLTLALVPAPVHDTVTRPMKLRRGARASWARSFA
jgi:hypothetical protein